MTAVGLPGLGVDISADLDAGAPGAVDSTGSAAGPLEHRILSGLGGLALGDALGRMIAKRSAADLDDTVRHILDGLAREVAGVPAGFTAAVSDDTILAMELVESLADLGHVSRTDYERRLRAVDPEGGKQIFLLKASSPELLYVAGSGHTNGCVPRAAVVGLVTPPGQLGDLCYDVLKVATLTHSAPSAVLIASLVGCVSSAAVAGWPRTAVVAWLADQHPALARIAGGGDDVWPRLVGVLDRMTGVADDVDLLEETLGMAVAADSSALTALVAVLSGLRFGDGMAALLRRRRPGWDFDSTAAVFGVMAGAFEPGAVPRSWVLRVEARRGWQLALAAHRLGRLRRDRAHQLARPAVARPREPWPA
jgi:ADP-ribosylglycohydrolase